MDDGEALLAAILADPADDAVRLVYADWLEEQGDEWFAPAFCIRDQVAKDAARVTVFVWTAQTGWRVDRGMNDAGRFMPGSWADWIARSLPAGTRMLCRARRGFVEEVRCPLHAWLAHGPAVVRAHPVRRVELAGARAYPPHRTERVAYFHPDVPGGEAVRLPEALFRLLRGYDNHGASPERVRWYGTLPLAAAALSAAAIEWARLPEDQR